jgi:hypothetical protein
MGYFDTIDPQALKRRVDQQRHPKAPTPPIRSLAQARYEERERSKREQPTILSTTVVDDLIEALEFASQHTQHPSKGLESLLEKLKIAQQFNDSVTLTIDEHALTLTLTSDTTPP